MSTLGGARGEYTGSALGVPWEYSGGYYGSTLEVPWEYSGSALGGTLGVLWEYSGSTLGVLWKCSGSTLGIVWECSGGYSGDSHPQQPTLLCPHGTSSVELLCLAKPPQSELSESEHLTTNHTVLVRKKRWG